MNDTTVKTVAIISDFEKAATDVARQFGADATFSGHVDEFLKAGETVRMGALNLFLDVNANNADLLAILPRLDTKEGKPGAGNNPEFSKLTVVKADGTNGEKFVSFYTILAREYPAGQKIESVLIDLKKRKENGTLIPVSYERDMKKWAARKTALRSVFRKMGKLYHQFEDLQGCALVKAYPAMIEQADGTMVPCQSAEPILLQSVSNVQDFKAMSVDAFLRLDIAEAVTKAGGADKVTKAHLLATVQRDDTARKLKPLAMATYPDYISGVWNFTDANGAIIQQRVHKRDAEGKALAVAMYRLQTQIGDIIDPLGKELAAWVDADDKAIEAKKATKAAA